MVLIVDIFSVSFKVYKIFIHLLILKLFNLIFIFFIIYILNFNFWNLRLLYYSMRYINFLVDYWLFRLIIFGNKIILFIIIPEHAQRKILKTKSWLCILKITKEFIWLISNWIQHIRFSLTLCISALKITLSFVYFVLAYHSLGALQFAA